MSRDSLPTWTPVRRSDHLITCRQSAPSLSISETVGVLREKVYTTNDQPFSPADVGMSRAFGNYFPGITINDAIGDAYDSPTGPLYGGTAPSLAIGPDAAYQGANTGVFQNRIMPSGTAIWSKGRHSISFGGSWSYTQLNVRDNRTGTGNVATPDFVTFANNWVTPYSTQNFTATTVSCRATPIVTIAPTKPAFLFRTSSR